MHRRSICNFGLATDSQKIQSMTEQNNKIAVVVISDLHVGSTSGLCPEDGIALDGDDRYYPSRFVKEMYRVWNLFWPWVNITCEGIKNRSLVINGDLVDGCHHNTVAVATSNISIQEKAAVDILKPVCKHFDRIFVTRGTEAHVGPSAQSDENIAKDIGAEIDEDTGKYSRWQVWLDCDGFIFNIAHHIGVTSSAAYESSAVMREMVAALVEAGQWNQQMPDMIVRSHRHRFITIGIPSANGRIQAVVTPGWQLRTPYIERIDRMRLPHVGGVVHIVENERCQVIEKIYPMTIPQTVKL